MQYAFQLDKPCAIRYPKGETVYNNKIMYTYEGRNLRLYPAGKLDIWAVGSMVEHGEKLREILIEKGYPDVGLVDVTTIKPLDLSVYDASCQCIITIEDHMISGGFGQQISAALSHQETDVFSFGWPDRFIEHGSIRQLQNKYGLTPGKMAERICEYLERKA